MTILNQIYNNLQQLQDQPILHEIHNQQQIDISAKALDQQICRARTFLTTQGICPGDRVALLAPNSANWVAIDLAIIAVGAIAVPLYHRQRPEILANMLADCQPSLLIVTDDELAETIASVWATPCPIVLMKTVFEAEPTQSAPYPIAPTDTVTIIYTSGTSGDPKGVMLTRANYDAVIPRMSQRFAQITKRSTANDRVFHFLPFCFAPARLVLWTQLYRANAITLSTCLQDLANEIKTVNPNYFLTVPMVLERFRSGIEQHLQRKRMLWLLKMAHQAYQRCQNGRTVWFDQLIVKAAQQGLCSRLKNNIASNLQLIICGSAPLSPETQSWFEMLGIPIYQGYGLTETTGIVTLETLDRIELGHVGSPIEGCELKLTPQGELICRGPNLFKGYWHRPEATAQVLRDGWFYTGDRAVINQQGSWRMMGRLKHILVPTSGHNISPEPLEQQLIEACDGIDQALLVGHGRPFLSAIVVGSADESALTAALQIVNKRVPHYQKIRKFYRTAEPFSLANGLLTANGKLRRTEIESRFHQVVEQLYQSA
ncbi:AMP-dependent synthetase/ligase [Leptothoe spongobia]|uniref:AMP-binding protein n=1 Tax=Leptothoe spongobia TAU-MAC 1115 TaxID=1967444 RepID=A0A947DF00_9CYAN|nr:AMP-binding protein [Leptothoe spongobia]MBT9315803.1 AMP-binding protein [Leptothoe spongobia TAU-MAC 1115]